MAAVQLPATLSRYRLSVAEYHRMIAAGILDENSKVELIEGELIEMAAAGGRHIACVNRLNLVPASSDRQGGRQRPEPGHAPTLRAGAGRRAHSPARGQAAG